MTVLFEIELKELELSDGSTGYDLRIIPENIIGKLQLLANQSNTPLF